MSDRKSDPFGSEVARPLAAGADLGRPRLSPKSAAELLQPERVPGPPVRTVKRNPVGRFLSLVFTLVVVAVLTAGGAIAYGVHLFTSPGPSEESRNVTVAAGSTLRDVAENFERLGIVSNRWVFWIGVRLSDQEAALKAGEYLIPAGASMRQVMEALVGGRSIAYAITIPEGLTSQQIVERIRANDLLVGDITTIPPEGSLLPETYHFQRGDTRENLLNRMRRDRDRVVTEIWNRRVEGLPIDTIDEFVILASIVERETALADERSRVASVFINRLRQGMRLQSDPTIIYGLYGGGGHTLTRSDLDTPNAYNTYLNVGLPPGPIANPGRASLEAVANPSRTNDLYFVADGTGGHAFAESLDQHNRNVARWREIEARANAAQQAPDPAPATPAPAAPAPAEPAPAEPAPANQAAPAAAAQTP
jgi:UPF0755 protein